ncbi:CHASE domain-containing protein [Fontisphaera persica]|uniref:CHASE domain-containing protein n=1 Tax=Fontisphaera persica TaxID=2974023 RepID=UPI0024C0C9AC|nr:CHASE domain-containing protein [Fontisphaera persica]WCJ59531.1 CHASE domain-containing protein [Fontisphaera persica]
MAEPPDQPNHEAPSPATAGPAPTPPPAGADPSLLPAGSDLSGARARMFFSLGLLAALGLVITAGILLLVYRQNQERRRLEFAKLADDRAQAVQLAANGCVEVLNAMADLYAASQRVEPEEFRHFATRAMQRHPETVYLAWLPRITHAQRQSIERLPPRLNRGFRILQLNTNGLPVTAEVRPEYFPVFYIEPFWENRFLRGLDHYAEPSRRAAMELARDTDTPVATPWIRLAQRETDAAADFGVFLYQAVYTNDLPAETVAQRRQNLAGYLAAVVTVEGLVRRALPAGALKNVEVFLGDESSEDGAPMTIHFTPQGWDVRRQPLDEIKRLRRGAIAWEGAVDLAGRPWAVLCYPTRHFNAAYRSWSLWGILLAGLLFTGFLVNYQRLIMQRASYVEQLVNQRTRELKEEIASRARLEEELQRERDLFHTLLDNLPDRIYFKDTQSRFLRINRALADLFGLQHPREAVGKSDFDFFTIEHARPAFEDEQEIIRTGQPLIGRIELETLPDGKKCWAHTTKMPFRDKQGRIIGTFGISRDITSLREMTEQLKKANADLQRSHEELKAAQMQLIQAEKMQSVGRLAAGVAHEVKNPLAILGMGLDYLASSVDQNDPTLRLVVEDMRQAIRRADNIILGLLDFSKPGDLELKPVRLNDIIQQALALTKHEQVGAFVQVETHLAPDLPPITGDARKLSQVFVNLFLNACQAMQSGGTLTVRTHVRSLDADEVRLEVGSREALRFHAGQPVVEALVDDTGPGIPPDKLHRIFDPFFTTKPTGQGTGLGLTVSRQIMEWHGGRIQILNRPEGGARAILWFPIQESSPTSPPPTPPDIPPPH